MILSPFKASGQHLVCLYPRGNIFRFPCFLSIFMLEDLGPEYTVSGRGVDNLQAPGDRYLGLSKALDNIPSSYTRAINGLWFRSLSSPFSIRYSLLDDLGPKYTVFGRFGELYQFGGPKTFRHHHHQKRC